MLGSHQAQSALRAAANTAAEGAIVRVVSGEEGSLRRDPNRIVGSDGTVADQLTARQSQVLGLVADGRSNSSISATLGISVKAVVHHTSRIYHALGIPARDDGHRRVQAILKNLARCGRGCPHDLSLIARVNDIHHCRHPTKGSWT